MKTPFKNKFRNQYISLYYTSISWGEKWMGQGNKLYYTEEFLYNKDDK